MDRHLRKNPDRVETISRAGTACKPCDISVLPVLLLASFLCKFSTSLVNFLLSLVSSFVTLASCWTCACNAITEFFHTWSLTLEPGIWSQSLAGTLNVYTQRGTAAVLCPSVTYMTVRSKHKCRIDIAIVSSTQICETANDLKIVSCSSLDTCHGNTRCRMAIITSR